jgi:pimeloyl-ACP methyl ester carboxylesterase
MRADERLVARVQETRDLITGGGDVVELFITVAAGLPAEMVTEVRDTPMWPVLEGVAHTIAYDGRIMGDTQSGDPAAIARRFASVAVPTLVMTGSESPGYQRNAVQVLADVLPNSQRRTLQGEGHQFTPAALAPVIREFFCT